MKLLHHVCVFVAAEAELKLGESFPQFLYLVGDVSFVHHYVMNQRGQGAEVVSSHTEASHLRYARPQRS